MYGAQKQDSRVIINRINELPEPVQFFIREVLKKQYVPVAAIFYQDVEPYKIDEWDDWWDGGQYEVLIVLDGDPDSDDWVEEMYYIARCSIKTDSKYGNIFVDDTSVGYWVSDLTSFWKDISLSHSYESFMFTKGKVVYAVNSFFNISNAKEPVGIFGVLDVAPQNWLEYAIQWFDIAEYAYQKGYYSHSAYLYRLVIEQGLKALLSFKRVDTKVKHNLYELFEQVHKHYSDIDPEWKGQIAKLYRKGAQFRYPDSSWIPTKEDIENLFRPTAKKVLDYVSSKISQ